MTDYRIMRHEVVEGGMGQTQLSLVGHSNEFGHCPLDNRKEPLKDFNREEVTRWNLCLRSLSLVAREMDIRWIRGTSEETRVPVRRLSLYHRTDLVAT